MFGLFKRERKVDADEQPEIEEDEITLNIPKSTLNLHSLYPLDGDDAEAYVDVVFVHGLGGDSYSTWTDAASGKLWPAHFLPSSSKFQQSRIMTFGYNAAAFVTPGGTKSNERLSAFGEQLMVALHDERLEEYQMKRTLILVGHSLGGLVSKSALVYVKARSALYADIVDSVNALVFFGTPHQGANIANWTTILANISKVIGIRSSTVTAELGLWSKPILDLNNLFTEQAADQNVSTFWEMEKYLGVQVVDEGSAKMGNVKKEISRGLKRNHRTICKFASADESEYEVVVKRFNAIATDIKRGLPIALPVAPSTKIEQRQDPQAHADKDLADRLRNLER